MALALTEADYGCAFIALFGPYALMYVSTWEEFYTGELIMPIVNGPNEGLWGSVGLSLVSYWYGPEYWQSTSGWDTLLNHHLVPTSVYMESVEPLRNADLLLLLSAVLIAQEVVSKSFMLSRKYGPRVFSTLFPFCTLSFCFFFIGWKRPDILFSMPRTSLHLCAVLFVEMTTELMLLHVTQQAQQYGPFRWILLPLMLLTAAVAIGGDLSSEATRHLLVAYAAAAGTYLLLKVVIVIHEICCILGIWCFDITSPRWQGTTTLKRD